MPSHAHFPSTRYQGSKSKLLDWIWGQIQGLKFHSCLDAFGGTGSVAYRLKQQGKQVTYNDVLKFNYYFGLALVENSHVVLTDREIADIIDRQPNTNYPTFVSDHFHDIYFTDEENRWIDQAITNIRQLNDPYKFALAFFALSQSCIIKRPYNLFHRKNLYIRFADVKRTFGNKTSWDRPFPEWFRYFAGEANDAVFDNSQVNTALNSDASQIPERFDLVYIDTPYISGKGAAVDYHQFYHFLEGLTRYDDWGTHLDTKSKHRRLQPTPNDWTSAKRIHAAFDRLFSHYKDAIIVVSYRSDGIPSEDELTRILGRYKSDVQSAHFGCYKYALSTNTECEELLLVGY